LSYYAATGVKAQAFVPILFSSGQTSQEAKYYQYVVGANDDPTASRRQLGLIEAILIF
jgi:hypothetical protein